MKHFIFIFLTLSLCLKGQDTIIQKDGNKIISYVLRITGDSIRYKRVDNLKGPDLFINKSEVSRIKYKSLRIDNLDSLAEVSNKVRKMIAESSAEELYAMGKADARIYYLSGRYAVSYAFLTTFFPEISFSKGIRSMERIPREGILNYPSKDLWKNKDYQSGYLDDLMARKGRAIRRGFRIGASISGSVTILFLVSALLTGIE